MRTMTTTSKTNLKAWRFADHSAFLVAGTDKRVTRGVVDGAYVYFLETLDGLGHLIQSVTFTSLTTLRQAL